MPKPSAPKEIARLPIVENWVSHNSGLERVGTFEYPLYTDARITGNIQRKDWPYAFLNTVPIHDEPGLVQSPVILRLDAYPSASKQYNLSKTDVSLYHGGLLTDEIASLASLCMGIRMKAGGLSRCFDAMTPDPLGRPVAKGWRPVPSLNLMKNQLILPDVIGTRSLDELTRLNWLFSSLTASQSISLIRAARLYQDALWIVESEPALAWLMFVSALETAANEWRSETGTLIERFTDSKPELVEILRTAGGDDLIKTVAGHIEHTLGATKKFINFTLQFLPSAPAVRPSSGYQLPWEQASMKKVLDKIYGYRSDALHGGIPFPTPMCDVACRVGTSEAFIERGTIGLSVGTRGGVWKSKDVPISLNTFHYIVRGVLLGWWESMKND